MGKSISNTLLRMSNYLAVGGISDQQIETLTAFSRSSNLVGYYMFQMGAQKWTKNILQYCKLNSDDEHYQIAYDLIYNCVNDIISTMPQQIYKVLSSSITNYKECIESFPKIKQNLSKLNGYLQKQFEQVVDKLTYGGKDSFAEIVRQWDI